MLSNCSETSDNENITQLKRLFYLLKEDLIILSKSEILFAETGNNPIMFKLIEAWKITYGKSTIISELGLEVFHKILILWDTI